MKLILCTLAVCLSILASVLTTQQLIRAEGKKTRSSLAKGSSEPAEGASRPENIAQKLDAINAQLATLSRRLAALEETGAVQSQLLASHAAPGDAQASARSSAGAASSAATLARLDALSGYLTELTTYLDKSFEHLEKSVAESTAPQRFTEATAPLSKKLESIESYFDPLYAFLGLRYDPSSADLLAAYPSFDVRINELLLELENLRSDVSAIRSQVVPRMR